MRCHLVYSIPTLGTTIYNKIKRRVISSLQEIHLPLSGIGNRQSFPLHLFSISSPGSVAKNIYQGFSSRMPTYLYHLHEKVRIRFEPDDIFFGHPYFPYANGQKGVTELSISQKSRPRIFALISPLHCNTGVNTGHINKLYLDAVNELVPQADILFAIMGEYWGDQWQASPYAHWLPKMVRLDMAIDPKDFPRVKTGFNPPGKRRFLFIGRNDPMKGIDLLTTLMSQGNFSGGWIGGGAEIPGIPRVSPPRVLTADFMQQIAEQFDFFITTGRADPNPTTILESMAWGFPVICTPQSGYYETSYRRNVYYEDIPRSLEVLRELQYAAEENLIRMAEEARVAMEKEYNWDKFLSTIFSTLGI